MSLTSTHITQPSSYNIGLRPTGGHQRLFDIASRSMLPLLLFSVALFVLLLLSWLMVVPQFTKLAVNGQVLSPVNVLSLQAKLQVDVSSLEDRRVTLVLPQIDLQYRPLLNAARHDTDVQAMLFELSAAGARASNATGVVTMQRFSFDASSGEVRVEGDVRNVGVRSLTVLASFIEEVEKLPFVHDLQRPAFTRIEDPALGPISPYVLTFYLHTAS